MRYIELLILLFVLSFFSLGISNSLKIYMKLAEKNKEVVEKTNACRFISESFKNTCELTGFSDLYQWQKICKAMWNLEYIGWSKVEDFLPLPKSNDKTIFYGKWYGLGIDGEVYWEN